MPGVKAKISEGGRVVIPAEYRRALNLDIGDEVLLSLVENEVRIVTTRQAIKRAQELVRRYVPKGTSLVDDLISERRAEARGE